MELDAFQLTDSLVKNFPQRYVHKTYPVVWRIGDIPVRPSVVPHVIVSIFAFFLYRLYKPLVFVTGVVRHEIQN